MGLPQFDGFQSFVPVYATPTNSYLSTISMAAPSPDWFSGFSDFPLHDGSTWLDNFVIATAFLDAGTEEGTTFSTSNLATVPHDPIAVHTAETFPNNGEPLETYPLTWSCHLASVDTVFSGVLIDDDFVGAAGDDIVPFEPVAECDLFCVIGDGVLLFVSLLKAIFEFIRKLF